MNRSTKAFFNFLLTIISLIATFVPYFAYAEATLKDVQTISRTIGFLENKTASNSTIAIIYDPSDSNSLKNAEEISKLISSERSGIQMRMVTISNLSKLNDADFAFISEGLSSYYKNLSVALRERKIVSFALNKSCVEQDCCTIYINSKDKVEIVVNKKVADSVNAQFKPIFLMMVTVI